LGIASIADNIDGEAVVSGRCVHVYADAFRRGPGKFRIAAAFLKCAGFAETAGAGPQTEGLVEPPQEELPFFINPFIIGAAPVSGDCAA